LHDSFPENVIYKHSLSLDHPAETTLAPFSANIRGWQGNQICRNAVTLDGQTGWK
jgi:hypothetical protein